MLSTKSGNMPSSTQPRSHREELYWKAKQGGFMSLSVDELRLAITYIRETADFRAILEAVLRPQPPTPYR